MSMAGALLFAVMFLTAPDAGALSSCDGWKVAEVPLRGSMAQSLVAAVPEEGDKVAAHYARIFMWDLDVRRDLEPGDRIRVVWRMGADGEPEIGAASYASGHLGKT